MPTAQETAPPNKPAPSGVLSIHRYRGILPKGPGRRVAVLVPAGRDDDLPALLADLHADQVLLLAPVAPLGYDAYGAGWQVAGTLAEHHQALKSWGPLDLLVDLLPAEEPPTGEDPPTRAGPPADVFGTLFFHLRPRGMYLYWPQPGRTDVTDRVTAYLRAHWQGDPEHRTGPGGGVLDPAELVNDTPATKQARFETELVAAVARVVVDRGFLLVQQRLPYLLKLTEAEVDTVLPARAVDATVSTLASRPAGTLVCRGAVVNHGATVPIVNLDVQMDYPELRLRHYRGRLAMVSNQLLTAEATVLPASYRYPRQLHNPRVLAVGSDFGRTAAKFRPTTELPGHWYHLDAWNSGHFGHTLTEVVPRLWGWHEAKEQIPDLKALFRIRYAGEREPTLELALLDAWGMDRSDVVWVHEPVWLESVVTATNPWQNEQPFFVHPEITAVWERFRRALVVPRPESPTRIFVSRRPGQVNRSCRNVAVVEDVFAAAGFTVVFPEDLTFADQATLFAHAEVVAGFSGSAMFNVMFADRLQTMIVVAQEAYTARYEHLFTMALGCTTHYFWSTPDVQHPVGGWSREAYYSSWEFDVERNGGELRALLAKLG